MATAAHPRPSRPRQRIVVWASRTAPPLPALLTISEAALTAGCNPASVIAAIERGELPSVELRGAGCARRVSPTALRDWMAARPG